MERLRITKEGKLIETKWVYDEAKEEGSYQEFDRTDSALRNLFEPCELEEGVTLRSVFNLINTELDIFDAIIGNWCKEIVTEALSKPAKAVGTYDPEAIEYLELYWDLYYDDNKDKQTFYGYLRPSFHGVGYELKEDKMSGWTNKDGSPAVEYPKGERIPWGICFTPANELIDLPLKLDTKATVYDDNHEKGFDVPTKTGYGFPLTSYDGAVYSLGNIIQGIIWELSFHGGPDKRDEMRTDLFKTVDEIRSGQDVGED